MCWELCNVETTFGSRRFVSVAFAVLNLFFVTPLVVFPLTVVVNEESVGSRDVCKDLLVVSSGDTPVIAFVGFGDDVVLGVITDVVDAGAEIMDDVGKGVVPFSISLLLQRLDRRQRMVT